MEDFMPGVVEQFVRENSMQISANCSGIVRSVLVPKVKTESPTLVAHGNRDMVKTFDLRELSHEVTIEGLRYRVRASNISFKHLPSIFANVEIARGSDWWVQLGHLQLVYDGRANNVDGNCVGAFANARMGVRHELIDACIYPIQCQLIEMERSLRGYYIS